MSSSDSDESGTLRRAAVDDEIMREVCGHYVTGVAIVTSITEDGPVGVTVNSFTSVSLSPPLVLFCIHELSTVWRAIRESRAFVVNILAEDQADVCQNFARRSTARITWSTASPGLTGAPILRGTLGYLDCRVVDSHLGGDHWIVVGEVVDTRLTRSSRPLTFFRREHPRLELTP